MILLLRLILDYGVYHEDSGNWLALLEQPLDDVGIILNLKGSLNLSVSKIFSTEISRLNLKDFNFNIPVYKLPFTYESAIRFTNSYSNSHRLWRIKK